jgi:hypothetical protein
MPSRSGTWPKSRLIFLAIGLVLVAVGIAQIAPSFIH